MSCESFRPLIDPLLDDELTAEESNDVRVHIESCADCSAHMRSRLEIARAVGEMPRYVAPDVLRAHVRGIGTPVSLRPAQPAAARSARYIALAAAAVVMLLGVGHELAQRVRASSVPDELLASHLRSLLPGRLIDVQSSDQHNVKPWFNGKIALTPDVPDLDSAGFVLVGGRLDYIGTNPVAVVVYRRRQHVINVYSWTPPGSRAPSAVDRNGFHLIRRERDGVERWIVSDLNRGELEEFARRYSPP